MKNKTIILIEIAVLILVFVALCGISTALIFGGGFIGGLKIPFAGIREGSLTIAQSHTFSNINEINVDAMSYSIYIEEHNSSDVVIEEYLTSTDNKKNNVSSQGGKVHFEQAKRFGFSKVDFGKIVIKVPQGSELSYDIKSASGSINLDAQSKTADLEATNGSISLYQAGGTAEVHCVSGAIKSYAPFNEMDASTISGAIKLTTDYKTTEVNANTVSGGVKILFLDTDSGYIMEYSSVSGSVKDEYNGIKYDKRGTARQGNQQIEIEVTTIDGSIKIGNWQ